MNAPELQPFTRKKGPTVGDRIRRCLVTGPRNLDTIRDVARIADRLRFRHGLNYEASMELVEHANRGTVKYPREVWEELLQVVDRWESQT